MNLKSTPIKREGDKQTKLQLDEAINNVEEGSLLFRSSGNCQDGYSMDGSGLHYFLTSTSGLDAYKPQEHAVRWYFWQYKVKETFIIINIPEYSQIHPLTVPTECTKYFDVKTEGTTRVERIRRSDNHQLDNVFYASVFEQLRPDFPDSTFGLFMPSDTMHEEVVLESVVNLAPYRFQSFANEPRKKRRINTSSNPSSTFVREIDFGEKSLFKQFVL